MSNQSIKYGILLTTKQLDFLKDDNSTVEIANCPIESEAEKPVF